MPLNRRSRVITEGDERSANRAMLYPVGFTANDFGKAIVGVAHGRSTMNPCNAGIQLLVDRAVKALKAAGAMPQTWGFPTGSDEISMGTAARRKKWRAPTPRYKDGILAEYARHVSSASDGAIVI